MNEEHAAAAVTDQLTEISALFFQGRPDEGGLHLP